MTGHKQIEQSLKRPDSFQDHILKGIQFVTKNKQRVMLMLSPVIVVAVIGYSVFAWMNHKASSRRAELAKIMSLTVDEQNNVGKQREEIQKQIETLRASKPGADGKVPEPSADALAKITGLEKQMADIKPDTSRSTEAYKKFYEKNKTTAEGWMAGLTWSGRQLQENKTADARPVVEEISKSSTSNKFYS